jgi:hypothetical protein
MIKESTTMPADPASAHVFFQNIPDTVWSGVVASVATFIGTIATVIVTNFRNTKRLKVQLDHDASENQKERLSGLRRDLYLKAAEATVRANAYFGGMTQVDVTKAGFDTPLRDVLAVAAQMQLVVNQSTAQLISDLVSFYGELQIRLIAKVAPIHALKSNIETVSALYENSQTEVKRVIAAMTQFNESGQRDPDLFQRLNRSAEIARDTSQRHASERVARRRHRVSKETVSWEAVDCAKKRIPAIQPHMRSVEIE